jgi:hypothetical protein
MKNVRKKTVSEADAKSVHEIVFFYYIRKFFGLGDEGEACLLYFPGVLFSGF